jgi:hypothetical protein
VKIYCASKAKHWGWWQALRAAGLDIRASWIDAEFNHTGAEPTADAWAQHWKHCIDEVSSADIVLVVARDEERQMGALVELGAGLGAGAMVYLVTPHDWSIKHHPRVRTYKTIADAVAALVAMQQGERARVHAGNGRAAYDPSLLLEKFEIGHMKT